MVVTRKMTDRKGTLVGTVSFALTSEELEEAHKEQELIYRKEEVFETLENIQNGELVYDGIGSEKAECIAKILRHNDDLLCTIAEDWGDIENGYPSWSDQADEIVQIIMEHEEEIFS